MKKLFAVIFTMMSLPLFADGKNDKSELLKHLKYIQSELRWTINENISGRAAELPQLPQEQAEQCVFAWKILEEFYHQADILQKIITEGRARYEFEVVCDNTELNFVHIQNKFDNVLPYQRMKTLVPVEGGFRAQDPVEISENVKQELFELFQSIFAKVYQQHRARFIHEKGKSVLFVEEIVADIIVKQCFKDVLDTIIWYPEALMYDWPLLKLIDAKITELEAQESNMDRGQAKISSEKEVYERDFFQRPNEHEPIKSWTSAVSDRLKGMVNRLFGMSF